VTAPAVCWICLEPAPDAPGGRYHTACAEALFGTPTVPRIGFDGLAVNGWADEHSGRLSISGYQPKAPGALSEDAQPLVLVETGSTHIVKPQHIQFHHIPQNEHLTMRLARMVGLDVAEHGLIELSDGQVAYLTRRFDRTTRSGARTHVVDFCQLAGLAPEDKESASTEECAALARQYGVPGTALALFRLFVFAYWVRNGDLHLKNLMLARRPDDTYALAPAYDLLCTEPYNVKGMILPVAGERMNIPRRTWIDVGTSSFGIDTAEAQGVIDGIIDRLPDAEALVERSFLPTAEWKLNYRRFLQKRTRQLAGDV
jgi:serine/threonine-protein kinase HipA